MNLTVALRWSLSLVLGTPAVLLAVRSHHAPLVAIGVIEALGAVLLQLRRTRLAGAAFLLLSLACASAFHALSGGLPPASFLVYVAAIAVVARSEPTDGRLEQEHEYERESASLRRNE